MSVDLLGMDLAETEAWIQEMGLQPYRAGQIRTWLFKGLISSFEGMTTLSKSVRAVLAEKASLHTLKEAAVQVSGDGTRKFLFRLPDERLIESVLIPERGHFTLCLSSQAGCAMGCRFCLTAKQGLRRNLKPSEILGQVHAAARLHGRDDLHGPGRVFLRGREAGEQRGKRKDGAHGQCMASFHHGHSSWSWGSSLLRAAPTCSARRATTASS